MFHVKTCEGEDLVYDERSGEALADHGRAPEKAAKASNATISQTMKTTF
jgi:hypothetical protein